jgi:uncharacterized protein (DUF1015 family)
MHIVPFKAILPKLDKISQVSSFFNAVKFNFSSLDKTHFEERETFAIYIYRIANNDNIKLGLVANTDLSKASEKLIIPHENTLKEKEDRMLELCLQRGAMIKPVLLIYPDQEAIDAALNNYIVSHEPILKIDFRENNEIHTLWELNPSETDHFLQLFNELLDRCYVADGHHRFKVASQLKTLDSKSGKLVQNNVLSIFFPFSQIEIFSFDRVVDFGGLLDKERFYLGLHKHFDIENIPAPKRPANPHQIIMLSEDGAFSMVGKEKKGVKVRENDSIGAEQIQKYILEEMLGIQDVQNDSRINYIPGIEDLNQYKEMLDGNPNKVAFLLFPLDLKDIISKADEGKTLPPKSSWFKPRIKNAISSIKIYT